MGSTAQGVIDRPALEKQWANHEARSKLSKEDRALWEESRHTVRPHVYFDKVLIAWTIVKGHPQIKEVFKVVGLDVSFQDGMWLHLEAEVAKRRISLTHSPRRLLPNLDIFGWIPFFNETRYASADWDEPDAKKNLRLAACFKMRQRGDDTNIPLVEGQDYLTELHVFREIWPRYKSTYF